MKVACADDETGCDGAGETASVGFVVAGDIM